MRIKKIVFSAVIIISSLLHVSSIISAEINRDNMLQTRDIATSNTNVHYTGKYCEECHTKISADGMNAPLRFGGDLNKLCKCHDYSPGKYTHPVDVRPSEEKMGRIPDAFPLKDGMLACSTCHDIKLQCRKPPFVPANSKFLRDGPYAKRTTICFRCHEEVKYRKLDPHDQLTADGKIIEEKCLYCHAEKPDESTDTYKDIKLIGDIKLICQRCHNILERHPAGEEHFKQPNGKILTTMKASEIIYSIILPLDSEGKITCITCHNPHERGVIPATRDGAKGASVKYRHRLEGGLCNACHDTYGT